MPDTQIAAQLYTIRDHIQTRADFEASMQKLRDIGYRAVQTSALGDFADDTVKRIVADKGLTICNTHVAYDALLNQPERVIAQHQLWDCRHVAIGSMPPEFRADEAGFRRFAEIANGIGERLTAAGLTFSYHNHSFEFLKFGGRTGLEILLEETDPRYVQAELDTYWIQHGGGDPVAWIERVTGRMPVVHLKDMVMVAPHPPAPSPTGREGEKKVPPPSWGRDLGWGQPQQAMAEVGAGNLNFPAILAACQRAGVEWYAVEQDFCVGDPFDSLAISYRNLVKLGLR